MVSNFSEMIIILAESHSGSVSDSDLLAELFWSILTSENLSRSFPLIIPIIVFPSTTGSASCPE